MRCTSLIQSLVAAALLFAPVISADSAFTNPMPKGKDKEYKNNPSYKIGQVIDVKWQTNEQKTDLLVVLDAPKKDGFTYQILQKRSTDTNYQYTVSLDIDAFAVAKTAVQKGGSAVLSFYLYGNNVTEAPKALSQYFNITAADESSTTSSKPTPKPTPTPQSTTLSTIISDTKTYAGSVSTGNPEATEGASSDSSSSSNAGVIGGAVGGTLGGLAVLGGIIFFAWRRYRNKKTPETTESNTNELVAAEKHQNPSPEVGGWTHDGGAPGYAAVPLAEAPGDTERVVHEAP